MKTRRIGSSLVCLLIFSTTGFSFADTSGEDPYKAIVDKYNDQYEVNLIYEKVDESISLKDYEDSIKRLAIGERETLDYIASREKDVYKPSKESTTITPYAATTTKTVTRTKTPYSVNNQSPISKSAYKVTYTYYTKYKSSHSPTKWVAVKSGATPTVKIASDLYGAYGFTKTSFSTKYLDSQRTIGLTIKGTVKIQPFKGSSYSVSGITVYTEYAYAS